MIHAVIAAAMTFLFGMVGAVFAAAFYIGREHAQAEQRWIAAYGNGQRANMPYWGGFDPKVWNLKSLGDCTLPMLPLLAVTL